MASTFISLNHRDGIPQLRAYTNATPSAIGNTFGAADNSGGITETYLMNIAPFRLFLNKFYATVGGKIWESSDEGTNWTQRYLYANMNAGVISAFNSGLHLLYDNGVPQLVVIYSNATNKYAIYSTDGATWTETGATAAGASWGPYTAALVHHGKLLLLIAANSTYSSTYSVIIYDPGTHAITVADQAMTSPDQAGAMCVVQDRVFVMNNHNGDMILWEIQGSSWLNRVTVHATATAMAGDGKALLMPSNDGTKVTAFYWVSAGTGWKCKEVTLDSWTLNDVSATVLPATMTSGSPPNTGRVGLITDGVASPGSAPPRYIYYGTSGSTAASWSMYQWNGNAAAMTLVDSGGKASDAMPLSPQVGGSSYFTSGQKKSGNYGAVRSSRRRTLLVQTLGWWHSKRPRLVWNCNRATSNQCCHAL